MEMNQIKFIYLFLILFELNLNLFNCLFINKRIHWRSIDDYEKPNIDDYEFIVVLIYYDSNVKDSTSILGYGTILSSNCILTSKAIFRPWTDRNRTLDAYELKDVLITPITNPDILNFGSINVSRFDDKLYRNVLKIIGIGKSYDDLMLFKFLPFKQRKEQPIVITPAVFADDYNFNNLEKIFVVTFDCSDRHKQNPQLTTKYGMPKSGIETLIALTFETYKSSVSGYVKMGKFKNATFCSRDIGSPVMAIKNRKRFQIGHFKGLGSLSRPYACHNGLEVKFILFNSFLKWIKKHVNDIKLTKFDSLPEIEKKPTTLTPEKYRPPSEYQTSKNDTSKGDHPFTNKFAIGIWIIIFIGFLLIISAPIWFIWKSNDERPEDHIISSIKKELKKEIRKERKKREKSHSLRKDHMTNQTI